MFQPSEIGAAGCRCPTVPSEGQLIMSSCLHEICRLLQPVWFSRFSCMIEKNRKVFSYPSIINRGFLENPQFVSDDFPIIFRSMAWVTRIPWVKNPELMMRIWRNLERKCPLKLEPTRILGYHGIYMSPIYGNVWDIFEDMINLIPKSSNIDMTGQHLKQAKIPW